MRILSFSLSAFIFLTFKFQHLLSTCCRPVTPLDALLYILNKSQQHLEDVKNYSKYFSNINSILLTMLEVLLLLFPFYR